MFYFLKIFLFILVNISFLNVLSQNIQYTFQNYSLRDGLAGNNVYCASQDKEGFIWFGTETGLSRFDGAHFKNYTVADGLPDNEILNIFTDSKGRSWLMPYQKSICFIYKNKIYNRDNDSLLRKIKILGTCFNITEDNEKNIIIHDTKAIHLVYPNGELKSINIALIGSNDLIVDITRTASGSIYIITRRDILQLSHGKLVKIFTLPKKYIYPFGTLSQIITDTSVIMRNPIQSNSELSKNIVEQFFNSKKVKFHFSPSSNSFIDNIDNNPYVKFDSGINFIINRKSNSYDNIFFNKPINRLFLDNEKTIYILTRNAGIYIKSKATIQQFKLSQSNTDILGISFIGGNKKKLYIGATNNTPIKIDKFHLNNIEYLPEQEGYSLYKFGEISHQICYINEKVNQNLVIANSCGLFEMHRGKRVNGITNISIKFVQDVGENYLIGTTNNLLKVSKSDYRIIDTIWNERTITANFINNNYFIGTINGLYEIGANKKTYYLGDSFPIFKRRISSIQKGIDGTIWVGTYDAGIVAYKNGKILQAFNDRTGLTSNICKNLFINGNYLWIGTNKGLNKIDISRYPYTFLINYTTADGLPSNMINAVYTDSNIIYVGTPEGLTYFDESKVNNNNTCEMRILGITASDKQQQWDSSKIVLKHIDNNIRFDFVALSFKSAGDIIYSYRLVGIDDSWKTTRENYLEYPIIPSGIYTLEIQATNKFGVKSNLTKIEFEVEKILIEKWWFRTLLLLLAISAIYFFICQRIKKINQQIKEKEIVANKVNEMEQMALKAQMNPHFIFNCLNSIQEYVINSDVEGANKYISDFSKLIRSTLGNSAKKTIPIEDEIKFLNNYLRIEQYRFENKFSFSITHDSNLNTQENHIPPMLLQPYIENAIRHGIKNKKEGTGSIQINISKQNKTLICEIIDNGIGIVASQALKGNTNIEYQSKGMDLTAKRIQLLNRNIENDIKVKIEDVSGPNTGTKVTVTIPVL